MSIYGVTLGSDGWYVVLQDVPRIGPLSWADALEVAEGLNNENAGRPSNAERGGAPAAEARHAVDGPQSKQSSKQE
jgi:hypothetical protein